MMSYFESLMLSLSGYAIMALSYYGWGTLVGRFLLTQISGQEHIFTSLWIGWCTTLLLFQTLHFVVPITAAVSGPVFFLGLVFLAADLRKRTVLRPLHTSRTAFYCVLLCLFAVWTASWAMLPPANYDSGLYHFNSVRWLNEYALVPGIGNLHPRLAFNQAFFTYAAALNLYPFIGHGHNLANSFLALLLIAECLSVVVFYRSRVRSAIAASRIMLFLSLCMLPVAVLIVVTSSISSPSTDIAATILQLLLFLYFSRYLEDRHNEERAPFRLLSLAILVATAVTVKLSMIVYAATIGFVVLAVQRHVRKRGGGALPKHMRWFLVGLPLIIMSIWILRGYVTSGYPLFPSTMGGLGVDWVVPRERAISEARWIYSWARQPGLNPDYVLGSWDWLRPWLTRMSTQSVTIVYPLVISVFAATGWVLLSLIHPTKFRETDDAVLFLLPLPVLGGLLFWFFSAPDPRFATALFFLLPPALLYPVLKFSTNRAGYDGTIFVTLAFAVVANGSLTLWMLERAPLVAAFPTQGYGAVPVAALKSERTASGLDVLVPRSGDQCWDSALPCTPYFDSKLHLRGRAEESGFSVQ